MSTVVDQEGFLPPLPPPLRWRSWPAREHPLRALILAGAVLAAGLVAGRLSGQPPLGWLAVAALALALWRFFVPVDYGLGASGIDCWLLGRRRRCGWKSVQTYEVCPTGVLVLPREDACPLDAPLGLYLPWSGHREEILGHFSVYLGETGVRS